MNFLKQLNKKFEDILVLIAVTYFPLTIGVILLVLLAMIGIDVGGRILD